MRQIENRENSLLQAIFCVVEFRHWTGNPMSVAGMIPADSFGG